MRTTWFRTACIALIAFLFAGSTAFAAAGGRWSAAQLVADGDAHVAHAEYGPAILAYERAQLLSPRDERVAKDLAHARELAGLSPVHKTRLDATIGQLTSDSWAAIALAGGSLACLALVAMAWIRSRRGLSATAFGAGAIVAVAAGIAAGRVAPDPARAVVMTAQAARIAPVASAEDAFPAHAGEDVRIEQRRGDFVYVRTREHEAGWLPASAVEPLLGSQRTTPRS